MGSNQITGTALKGLHDLIEFNWPGFSKDKTFSVVGVRQWSDYNTKELLGSIVDTVITKDDTPYKSKNGVIVSNLYRPISFKVRKPLEQVTVQVGTNVVPVNATATVYGNFHNQLSVKCDDIVVVTDSKETD